MKNLIFLFLILSVSCNKEELAHLKYHPGTASAKMNGEDWKGNVRSGPNEPVDFGIFIDITHFDEVSPHYQRSVTVYHKIPFEKGKYVVNNSSIRTENSISGATHDSIEDGGHVGGDGYDVLTEDDIEDYIEIIRIEGNDIYGTFQGSFAKHLRIPERHHAAPDTVIFTEGVFHAKYVE